MFDGNILEAGAPLAALTPQEGQDDAGIQLVDCSNQAMPAYLAVHRGHTDPRYVLDSEWARAFSEVGLEDVLKKIFPLAGYELNYAQHLLQRVAESDPIGVTRAEAMAYFDSIYKKEKGLKPGPRTISGAVKNTFRQVARLLGEDIEMFELGNGVAEFIRLRAVDEGRKSCFAHVPDERIIHRAFHIAQRRLEGRTPGMDLAKYKSMFGNGRYPLEAVQFRGSPVSFVEESDGVTSSDYVAAVADLIVSTFYETTSEYAVHIWEAVLLADPRGISFSSLTKAVAAIRGLSPGDNLHKVRVLNNTALRNLIEHSDLLIADSHVKVGKKSSLELIDRVRLNPDFRFRMGEQAQRYCLEAADVSSQAQNPAST